MIGRGTPNSHSKIPRPMIATPPGRICSWKILRNAKQPEVDDAGCPSEVFINQRRSLLTSTRAAVMNVRCGDRTLRGPNDDLVKSFHHIAGCVEPRHCRFLMCIDH
jgi:hypothetical protein